LRRAASFAQFPFLAGVGRGVLLDDVDDGRVHALAPEIRRAAALAARIATGAAVGVVLAANVGRREGNTVSRTPHFPQNQ
jgi:hypothetical protein